MSHRQITLGGGLVPSAASDAVVELAGFQRPGDLVKTEDDAGRHCFRADELERAWRVRNTDPSLDCKRDIRRTTGSGRIVGHSESGGPATGIAIRASRRYGFREASHTHGSGGQVLQRTRSLFRRGTVENRFLT